MNNTLRIVLICSAVLLFCSGIYKIKETPYMLNLPAGFPAPVIPADNQLTAERVLLGKKLFYDTILSSDRTLSCASCHIQQAGFTDRKTLSTGVNNGISDRNSMALVNLAWSNAFFWDGGVSTLELQVLKPLTSHNEMNLELPDAIKRLNSDKEYKKLFMQAYGAKPDANTLFKALASFERTLVSGNSKFDQYFYQKRTSAFNESELRGYKIFFSPGSKVHCASCHSGINLTNDSYQNNGLYEPYQVQDQGRFRITGKESDKAKFKVPTLRNIGVTAPYMHDGSLATLEDVIDHYNSGGKNHPNKSPHVHIHKGMELTDTDKRDLINFLHTLTDPDFLYNPEFQP